MKIQYLKKINKLKHDVIFWVTGLAFHFRFVYYIKFILLLLRAVLVVHAQSI